MRQQARVCDAHACTTPAQPPWQLAHYRYSTSGAALLEAMRDLSAATHVTIAVDAALPGRVEGRFEMTPQRFLETLAQSYGMVWYYDGAVLHVDAARAQRTLTVRLNYAKRSELHRLLAQTGIDDPRFPVRDDVPARGLVSFRGPPSYLALAGHAAQQLEAAARARVTTAVRIVPLHYGSAADRAAFTNGQANLVLGVASRAARALDPHDDPGIEIVDYEAPLPVITADPRTNAVLIRDRPQRLNSDARGVVALDRPEALVAIHLLIADLRREQLLALGLGAASPQHLRGAAARELPFAVRASSAGHPLADSELQTVDGVAIAWDRHAERPVASVDKRVGDSASSPAPSPASIQASPASAGAALRIVPQLVSPDASPKIRLAVEWRGATIDVARATLDPQDALVMLEAAPPGAGAGANPGTDPGTDAVRAIVLTPRIQR